MLSCDFSTQCYWRAIFPNHFPFSWIAKCYSLFFSYVVLKQVPVYDFYHMSDICRLWLKKENS
ncbi:hypothetical protein pdam_00004976 [Pocillopora damicornis]|uniref:Uncharacterized protein n=2 Tax=Pocillopora TaxID=46730 RepID=A0A3M6UVZ8_POCDA|nr:hypothetical protein pdam_00004976 [Pocillopora damicornis]CAH3157941.1 unnamed protein product [Pocillopora meandrina]